MTQCALDTTIRKQTQITLIKHEPSYKQRGGKEGVKPLIHQSELGTYTKVVPFQEKSSFDFVVL